MVFRVVTGITGSGKTTYSKSLDGHHCHYVDFDRLYKYGKHQMDYAALRNMVKSSEDDFVMDGIMFGDDPKLQSLIAAVKPHSVALSFLYTSLEHLYECQRSTEVRAKRMEAKGRTREEHFAANRRVLKNVCRIVGSLSNVASSIEYIYRLEGDYQFFDDNAHFLSLMKESV
jgi:dephospho-CoA kinase